MRFERFRTFVRHHYFAEAVVAYTFGMVSTWTLSIPLKIVLTMSSLVFIAVAIISKQRADSEAQAERDALKHSLRSLGASSAKRPMVQVSFSWERGEPKDKPLMIVNAGDEEARQIQIHPIKLGSHTVTFDPVGQLLPKSEPVPRKPLAGEEMGFFFRTLIDVLDRAIRERKMELKTALPTDEDWTVQLDRHVRAETKGNEEFSEIPVAVSYENRKGPRTTLEYRLHTRAFAEVMRTELEFVAER